MKRISIIAGLLLAGTLACFGARPKGPITLVASECGAAGDGKTLNTEILQAAIDRIGKAGGGTFVVSNGCYLTGGLFLRSNVELRIEAGATLLGSTNPYDYTAITLDNIPEGRGMDSSRMGLIVAQGVNNIKITGYGTIDGQGRALALNVDSLSLLGLIKDPRQAMMAAAQGPRPPMSAVGGQGAQAQPQQMMMPQMNTRRRPSELMRQKLIFCTECDGVLIENLHLRNSSVWGVSFDSCENVTIKDVDIHNRAYWNNDGIDMTDSKHVRISGCNIDAADDGICLKSNRDDAVNEDIVISDCTIASSASAIKFGTASYGAWKDVHISNIRVKDTFRSAIAIESVDGAKIEDVTVDGVVARNTGNAIFIRLGQRAGDGNGYIRNVRISNLSCEIPFDRPDVDYDIRGPIRDTYHNQYPCSITGIPGSRVEGVVIENVELIYPGRSSKGMGYVPLDRLDLVSEQERGYPEYSMFGELPAWAFYVRHADDISFRNVRLFLMEEDYRPAFVLDDVKGASFHNVSFPLIQEEGQIFLNNSTTK